MANRTWGDPANPRQQPTDNDIVAAELENGSGNFVWRFGTELVNYLATKFSRLVSPAVAGNFAGLDAQGQATDSGSNAASFEAAGAVATHDASGAAHGGVQSDFAAHKGAGGAEHAAATGAAAGFMSAADKTAHDAHIASTANPHGVTAVQAGAIPTVGTADGDLIPYDGTSYYKLGVGTNGFVLTARPAGALGAKLVWEAVSASSSPLTTKGDIYGRNATADARIPVGANNTVLTADSSEATGVKWEVAQFFSPTQAQGDLIQRGAGADDERLAIGTAGQVLTVSGSAAAWAAPAGDVSGPGSSGNNNLSAWSGTGGDTLIDTGINAAAPVLRNATAEIDTGVGYTSDAPRQLAGGTNETVNPALGNYVEITGSTGTTTLTAGANVGTVVYYVPVGVSIGLTGFTVGSGSKADPGDTQARLCICTQGPINRAAFD